MIGRSHIPDACSTDLRSAAIAQVLERRPGRRSAARVKRQPRYTPKVSLTGPSALHVQPVSEEWVPIPTQVPPAPLYELPTGTSEQLVDASDRADTHVTQTNLQLAENERPAVATRVLQQRSFTSEDLMGPADTLRSAIVAGDIQAVHEAVEGAVATGAGTPASVLAGSRPPALVLAAALGNTAMVTALLALGGTPLLDKRTLTGETALHSAAAAGHYGVVAALVAANPRAVHFATAEGSTALHRAGR